MAKKHNWRLLIFQLIILVAVLILGCNFWIIIENRDNTYSYENIDALKPDSLCLVLGTSPHLTNGDDNPHFTHRIEAAVALYKKGKVKKILVSGSSQEQYYNEAKNMQKALLERNVPAVHIIGDSLGFRTFDSIKRAKSVIGAESIILVSDRFHVYRALFIARRVGLKAQGFACENVPIRFSYKTRLREVIARVRAIVDIYIVQTAEVSMVPPKQAPAEAHPSNAKTDSVKIDSVNGN